MGTRLIAFFFSTFNRDHPHACGDKVGNWKITGIKQGSSPRVWGQGYIRHSNNTIRGIIPTRVGTSTKSGIATITVADHPHACGDKI